MDFSSEQALELSNVALDSKEEKRQVRVGPAPFYAMGYITDPRLFVER